MMRPALTVAFACLVTWWAVACSSESTREQAAAPADARPWVSRDVDASPVPVVQGFDIFDRAVQAACGRTDTNRVRDFFAGKELAVQWDFRCFAPMQSPIVIEIEVSRASEVDERGPVRVSEFRATEVERASQIATCLGVLAASRAALEIIAGQDAQEPMSLLRRGRTKPRFETSWAGFDLVFTGSKIETGETVCRFVITPTPT